MALLSVKSQEVLQSLTDGKTANKSDLFLIVKNWYSVSRVIEELSSGGYVDVHKRPRPGGYTYSISITQKGLNVAQQLRKTEEVARAELQEGETTFKMVPEWRDRFKGLSTMMHLNVLDDHVAIEEIDYSGKTSSVVTVYVKRIDSHFELWCEKDESKECKHVDFAWSLPHMRALIEDYIREGKIKEVGRAE